MLRLRLLPLLRWSLRWGPRLGLIFLLALVLGWFILSGSFDSLAKRYISQLNQRSGVQIEVGKAILTWKQVEVRKLRLLTRDGKVLLSAERGQGQWYMFRGWSRPGWQWLGDAQFEKVDANLYVDREGRFNWSALRGTPGGGPPLFWTQYVGRLTAREAIINYHDERDGEFYYSVSKVTAHADFAPGQPVRVEGQAEGDQPAATAQLRGHFSPLQPRLDARVEVHGWPLEEAAKHPKISNHVIVRGGHGSGRLWLHGQGESWALLWKNLLREVRLQIEGAEARLPRFPETVQQVHGELRWSAGNLETAGLSGKMLGGSVDLRGRLSTSGEGADGHLTMRGKQLNLTQMSRYLKAQLKPVKGLVDVDVVAEGSVKAPSLTGSLSSPKVVLGGREFSPLSVKFQWAGPVPGTAGALYGGALHLSEVVLGSGGGKFKAHGWIFPGTVGKTSDPQVLMQLEADNANLSELFPGLSAAVRADGRLSILGSPLDPVVAGQGSVRGLASTGAPVQGGQGSLLADRAGAILFDAQVDSSFGGLNLPWAFYDFRSRYGEAALVVRDFLVPQQNGLSGQFDAALRVRGRLDDPKSWVASGRVERGTATVQGEHLSNVNGSFLLSGGDVSTPGMAADWGGGKLAVVGAWDSTRRQLSGVVGGEGVAMGRLTHNSFFKVSGLPGELRSAANFLASFNLSGGESSFRGWLDSGDGRAAALGFGQGLKNFNAMAWFDSVDTRHLGLTSTPSSAKFKGQVALQSTGKGQTVYYDATSEQVRLLGEVSHSGAGWSLGRSWLTFPGRVASQTSPKILEGGAYPYHGPDTGMPLLPARQIGENILIPSPPSLKGSEGLLAIAPSASSKGRYDFWAEGLDLVPLSRLAGLDLANLLQRKTGLNLLSGGLFARGSVTMGPDRNPQVALRFQAPWLDLQRPEEGDPVALGLAGSLRSTRQGSWTGEARLSPRPYSTGSPNDLKISGNYAAKSGLDMRLSSSGFPLDVVRPLMPLSWSPFLPSGRLDIKGMRVWGNPLSPSLDGELAVRGGRFWLRQQPVDMEEARLRVSSTQGQVRIDEMAVHAGPLHLEGEGLRGRDNRLSGLVKVHQFPLSFLKPLGKPWSDIDGQVEAQVAFKGTGLIPHEFFASLTSPRLSYRPPLVGKVVPVLPVAPFTVESLVLGKAPTAAEGVHLRFLAGEVVVDFPEGGVSADLVLPPAAKSSGHLGLAGQLHISDLPKRDFVRWLTSATGPVFGDGKRPLVLSWTGLSWPVVNRYLGWSTQGEGESSGQLRLAGQYFQEHSLQASANPRSTRLPFVEMFLDQLQLSRGLGAEQQVLTLKDQLTLRYQRSGDETWLHIDPFRFLLGESANRKSQSGELRGELHAPVAQQPNKPAKAGKGQNGMLKLEATQMPVDMLSAFFPFLSSATGTIERLSLDATGELLRPQMNAELRLGPGSLSQVKFARVEGHLQGAPTADGQYRLDFSAPRGGENSKLASSAFQIYLGNEVSPLQRFFVEGGLNLRLEQVVSAGRTPAQGLQPVWQQYRLSNASTLELHAELVDQQARVLASLMPGSETEGKFSGNLDIKGSLATPELSGVLAWENGAIRYPWLGAPLTGIQVSTRFERVAAEQAEGAPASPESPWVSRYTLEKMEGMWGGHSFRGKGKAELVGLEPQFLNVTLEGKELPLKVGDYFKGTGDVDLKLVGVMGRSAENQQPHLVPVLSGDITVPKGDLTVPLGGPTVSPGWANFWRKSPVRYDIDLNLGDDVWAYFLNSSVRGQGTLKIVPALGTGTPVAVGDLFLSRGVIRIPLYEVNFRVRQGHAYFEEDLLPTLENVEADTNLGGHQITARFDGKYPDLRAELVSNPPLPETELQRLVGLDVPQSSSSSLGTLNQQQNQAFLSNQGVTFLSNLLTGQLTQGIGRALFLSEVSFDFLPPNDYLFRVAKSLDDRDTFLLTFSQVVNSSSNNQSSQQYGVEWRFKPNLLTRISVDNYGQARLWFQGLLKF